MLVLAGQAPPCCYFFVSHQCCLYYIYNAMVVYECVMFELNKSYFTWDAVLTQQLHRNDEPGSQVCLPRW